MKIDPYNHKERYLTWKRSINQGVPGLSRVNSDIVISYVTDMEKGINISSMSTKGSRSYPRLNTIKDRISKLTKQRERLEKEEQKIITIEKDLGSKKLKFEKENKEFFIKKALDKYKQRYPNIFYDEEEGYIKFSNNGDYLHRFIYRRKFDKNLGNKVVHHIDTDKLNNDDYNLISIPYERHKELNHTLIDFKDWESGIKQLKEQLDMEDSDFPEHIQKKIEEIRRQKRLGAYARKSRRRRR
jgi:hypothetical protein